MKKYFLILFSISILMGGMFYYFVELPRRFEQKTYFHNFVTNNYEQSPELRNNDLNKRILVPLLLNHPINFLTKFVGYHRAFEGIFLIFDIFSSFLFTFSLFLLCSIWFPSEKCFTIILFSSLLFIFTFKSFVAAPWDLIQPGLFALGLYLIYKEKLFWFLIVLIISTINRSTSIFLPIVFLLYNFRKQWLKTFIVFLTFGIVILFLTWLKGKTTLVSPFQTIISNLRSPFNLINGILDVTIMVFPCLVIYFQKSGNKLPPFLKICILTLPLWAFLFIFFKRYTEISFLPQIFPFFIPSLFYLSKIGIQK
ncbi:MAG: hypothetical protein HY983_00385 [Candidatus Magasanikbacteria bacterium]|nr:hypothetical protein [Candidatus Magasanikbacteria bacterium]